MTFPDSPRVIYRRNPLAEVVAQLRFPPILKIDSETPASFQDAIRGEYPHYSDASPKANLPPNLPPQFMSLVQGFGRQGGITHQFASADQKWIVTLTRESLELKAGDYLRWESFKERLSKLRSTLEKVYFPAAYTRVGIRYVDIIRRSSLNLAEVPWSALLKPYIAGELSAPELADGIDSASRQLHCHLGDDCFLTLTTGIALAEPSKEKCFLIDGDFHTHGQTETSDVLNILDTFNRTAGRFFRWCIEQRLHAALEPGPVSD